MSPQVPAPREFGPPPERGLRVFVEGLPGGPLPTVVDRRRDDVVELAPPRRDGRPVALPVGRPVVLAYSQREVPCEVDGVLAAGPGPEGGGYRVRLTGPPRRLQRRAAVRVPVALIARAEVEGEGDAPPVAAVTENLSAAGALLRMPSALEAGRALTMVVEAGAAAGSVEVTGRVVRCDRQPDAGGARPWRIAVAFDPLPPADEDRLVRLVFDRMREVRRRELGDA